jgi:chromosome segregation ATPase
LGIRSERPKLDVSKATPGDLLDYLIEKFHTIISKLQCNKVDQLKEEEKAKLKAEYEVYELKQTLQKELLKQEQVLKKSQEEISKLDPLSVRTEKESINQDLNRKDVIIKGMEQKFEEMVGELERERQKSRNLKNTIKELTDSISAKDNEAAKFERKLEELIERKNKLQKECSTLKDENKTLSQTNNTLEAKYEELKKNADKAEESSRKRVDELRTALKKNSALLKQVTVILMHNNH